MTELRDSSLPCAVAGRAAVPLCTRRGRRAALPRLAAGLVAAALFLGSAPLHAATVTLKIKAINRSPSEKKDVEVKAHLPRKVQPSDVVDRGPLELSYDSEKGEYYVHGKVELEPGEIRTLDVIINDVWVVPEAEIEELRTQARTVAELLKGTAQADVAGRLDSQVDQALRGVLEEQQRAAIPLVQPLDHIRAYEAGVEAVEAARRDVGMLENLAIGEGKPLERLLGSAKVTVEEREASGSLTGRTVVVRIKVTNSSPSEKRPVPIRRDLPREIKPADVVDPGELQVGFDFQKNCTYLALSDLELDPLETREFEVRVRNKWIVDPAYLDDLEGRATNVLAAVRRGAEHPEIDEHIRQVQGELQELRDAQPPAEFGDEYLAFYRQQADRLKELDARLLRVEVLFHPRPARKQPEFLDPNIQPPSVRTTWILIYTVIVFLFVLSLLFFLRWYGKSKAERR